MLYEFGGIALRDETAARPRAQATRRGATTARPPPTNLLARYREQWAVVHESTGLAGACWTQLTDTYQEVNGLLRFDRTPKAPLEAFARPPLSEHHSTYELEAAT